MIGALLGIFVFWLMALYGGISFWWIILGCFLGGFSELLARVGLGEPLGEMLSALSDLIGAFLDLFSCFKGSD